MTYFRQHRRVFLGLAVALALWCAVDVRVRASIDLDQPHLHMTDLTVYTEAAAAFFDGRPPYEVTNIRGWPYVYPPLFALLLAPLTALDPPNQAVVWFAISVLMGLGCFFECRRLLSLFRFGPSPPRWIITCAAAATVFPTLNCLQRGQVGVGLVYLLLLGIRLILCGRGRQSWCFGGALLALPIAVKLTPALPATIALLILASSSFKARFFARDRDDRAAPYGAAPVMAGLGLAAGCLAFFLLIPSAILGWSANLAHLETFYDKVLTKVNDVRTDDFGGHATSIRNQSLANGVYRFGNWTTYLLGKGPNDLLADQPGQQTSMPMDHPSVATALLVARMLALAAIAVVALRAGFSHDRGLALCIFAMACAGTLVVSPISRGHYFTFQLPAVLFVPLWLHNQGRVRASMFCAGFPAALCLAHYILLDFSGRVGLLGIGTTLWYFASCLLVALPREPSAIEQPLVIPIATARPPRLRRAA